MTNRIQEDELLRELAEDNIVRRPIIIVDVEGDKHRYRLFLAEVDQLTHQPKMFGIIMSDLLDHLAAAYRYATGRDERDIRQEILRVMKDEDRFKAKEPDRGKLRGLSVGPKPQ